MGKAQSQGDQTLTFTKEEVEALYLCAYTVQDLRFPTTPEQGAIVERALLRQTRAPSV